jgi:hypothetical protein
MHSTHKVRHHPIMGMKYGLLRQLSFREYNHRAFTMASKARARITRTTVLRA